VKSALRPVLALALELKSRVISSPQTFAETILGAALHPLEADRVRRIVEAASESLKEVSVAHFFLDYSDNEGAETVEDMDGAEFPSLRAAQTEAKRALVDIARDNVSQADKATMTVTIRNAKREVLSAVVLSYTLRCHA
jgi:hypothetical protein